MNCDCGSGNERCDNSGGLLTQFGVVELLDMAIKQEDLESKEARRRPISMLREDIEKVKQLLRGI